ncbi:MAG: UDP-N-acetylglucosamine 2-epimerase (hydrolyzing) [Firmicutes bacterium]|nr:UDP-N-acetylglucosamine 2-epimerase (hydrolyzing) [Bacillota bacterium]
MNYLYISGTRADYGRMRPLLLRLDTDKDIDLKILATGMHLKKEFGFTLNEIQKDFNDNLYMYDLYENIDINDIKAMPLAISSLINYLLEFLIEHKVEILILFGDRVEMFAAAIAAAHIQVKIIHIGGGDSSGSIDDKYRDAISLFSNYHFVSIYNHLEKLTNFNISPKNIFVVGSLDISSIDLVQEKSPIEIFESYGISLNYDRYCILLFHPDVMNVQDIEFQINNIIAVLRELKLDCIVIGANSDYGSKKIMNIYNSFISESYVHFFGNISYDDFINLLRNSEFLIGNSSSGIIEASYIPKPAINIGKRQANRIRANNVIDVNGSIESIYEAISIIKSDQFINAIDETRKLYGDGSTLNVIYQLIKQLPLVNR